MRVGVLNQRHPSYDGERLARMQALHDGGAAWDGLKASWFPMRKMEPSDVRQERLELAHYINYTGNIIGSMASMLFSEAPSVAGLEGEFYTRFFEDVDRQGSSWAEFWRARFLDALVQRKSWVWVNLPRRPVAKEGEEVQKPGNLQAELTGGFLDAFLVGLSGDQVIDWGEDDSGRLAWVVIHDVVSKRGGVGEARKKVFRWTYVTGTLIQRWEWTATEQKSEPGRDDEATEVLKAPHNMGSLPVFRLELPILLWPMGRLEDPAIALTRSENDLHWALHQAANELLVVASKWAEKGIGALGHGHFMKTERDKNGRDEVYFVAPSGVAFEHLEKQVERLRDDLHRVVSQMAQAASSDSTRARMSGESKNADWRAAEVMLAAFAGLVLDAMRDVLRLIAGLRGDPGDIQVSGLDGWHQEDIMAWLESAALATEAHQLSPTFRRVVARRQAERVLPDASSEQMEAIHKEIEEADVETGPLFAETTVPDDDADTGDHAGE